MEPATLHDTANQRKTLCFRRCQGGGSEFEPRCPLQVKTLTTMRFVRVFLLAGWRSFYADFALFCEFSNSPILPGLDCGSTEQQSGPSGTK